jgi:hypothetical protein
VNVVIRDYDFHTQSKKLRNSGWHKISWRLKWLAKSANRNEERCTRQKPLTG